MLVRPVFNFRSSCLSLQHWGPQSHTVVSVSDGRRDASQHTVSSNRKLDRCQLLPFYKHCKCAPQGTGFVQAVGSRHHCRRSALPGHLVKKQRTRDACCTQLALCIQSGWREHAGFFSSGRVSPPQLTAEPDVQNMGITIQTFYCAVQDNFTAVWLPPLLWLALCHCHRPSLWFTHYFISSSDFQKVLQVRKGKPLGD